MIGHGATPATQAAGFGKHDDPLLPRAVEALPRLRARLGWHGVAHAAPSRAARDTAAALADTMMIHDALRDCDHGSWHGQTVTEIAALDPEGFARWTADPKAAPHGGESLAEVLQRVAPWLEASTAPPTARLVVVSPFLVRALVVAALGWPPSTFWQLDAAPLSTTRLTAHAGRWRLAALNVPA